MVNKPERIMLLKVPIDIVTPDDLPDVVSGLLPPRTEKAAASEKGLDIVLLSIWDLLRARRNNEYREYVFNASLVIPISKSLVSGAKFITGKDVYRHMPFKFVISLLTFLEKEDYSLYIFGGSGKILKRAEKNLRMTFPHLKIVGRCEGAIKTPEVAAVTEAIRKASPTLLLIGKGGQGKELWIHKNTQLLNSGFRLWCSDLLDVFAEKKRRPSDWVFEKGLEGIGYCFRNPWKLFRFFSYIRYKILLVFYKILKK